MVLGQFSDICGLWSANIRKLAKDNKGYGSAAISGVVKTNNNSNIIITIIIYNKKCWGDID
jgi:hypothetical protein